jgi:transcriptional regulator with XRE-family HTH domain
MGLKELRKQADLTQVELAKRTGIARTIISSYDTGRRDVRNMTLENALKISSALNCQPSDLMR